LSRVGGLSVCFLGEAAIQAFIADIFNRESTDLRQCPDSSNLTKREIGYCTRRVAGILPGFGAELRGKGSRLAAIDL
jgi:hypothetical protein